ncbi:MAG: anthranilate synthase component I [Rhizobiales bacterium]|nr:anthranilate synthase component I [Hyphomicrobiales bacterium]
MLIEPSKETVLTAYNEGKPQVVWTTLVADLETPVSAMLKLSQGEEHCFLLESVEGGAVRGRYSIIGMNPDLVFKTIAQDAWLGTPQQLASDTMDKQDAPALTALREILDQSRIELPENLPPMAAGMFGYLGYDNVRLMEDLPEPSYDPLDLNDTLLIRPLIIVIFDNVKDELTMISPIRPEAGVSAETAYSRAVERLTSTLDRLDAHLDRSADTEDTDLVIEMRSNTTEDEYFEMVRRAKEYITAGDIFQVVLSQRFETEFTLPPFALYRALRRVNPAPFLYFLKFGDFAIIGSSPEILVRARDGEVSIRPIAGTRPRGATPEEDAALSRELLADPKELAEHLMLLDLGRNDVGRVAEIGTVEVTDQFFLEYYSQVMHIVSNVVGKLSDKYDAIDALSAGFPAGTVSGAPKVRAMEIIDELEKDKRGPYGGAVGYFTADGYMDTCIVLRTSVVKDGMMYVQAGAGIVADSVAASEQQECMHKARALFRAAEEAVRFASSTSRGQ